MQVYDIGVIGAGPAGCMAAIRASEFRKAVVLIERNESIGKKILLSGKGRCNITNIADIDTFIEKFGHAGKFFRSAFSSFSNNALIDFFKKNSLEMKKERQGRVFPATDKSSSVVEILKNVLSKNGVTIMYNSRLMKIEKKDNFFILTFENNENIKAKKVIIATGGLSYRKTGSTGDGLAFAKDFGHSIISLKPCLVPLKTEEKWVENLAGLSLKNIRITIKYENKKIESGIGELLFTHFGISGPLILDLSGKIISLIEGHKKVEPHRPKDRGSLPSRKTIEHSSPGLAYFSGRPRDFCEGLKVFIDLKPALSPEQVEARLIKDFASKGKMQFNNIMKDFLPVRLRDSFIHLSGIDGKKMANQITQSERKKVVNLLKNLPLTVIGSLSIEEAMVTDGGISQKEIDPKTMESKIMRGLYFAGEIIDGAAPSGGYNMQMAFSTGYLSGESSSQCVK